MPKPEAQSHYWITGDLKLTAETQFLRARIPRSLSGSALLMGWRLQRAADAGLPVDGNVPEAYRDLQLFRVKKQRLLDPTRALDDQDFSDGEVLVVLPDSSEMIRALVASQDYPLAIPPSVVSSDFPMTWQAIKAQLEDAALKHREEESRILFLLSNPVTTGRLELAEELRSLELELHAVKYRDYISWAVGGEARPDDMVRLLRRQSPSVVHFSGHGSPEGIMLRSDSGAVSVPGTALAKLFRDRGVALIVLNSCYSENQAHALLDVVPAVVGTTEAVEDEAARRFATAFYRTLGDGYSVSAAFRDGTDAVVLYGLQDVFFAHGNLELCPLRPR